MRSDENPRELRLYEVLAALHPNAHASIIHAQRGTPVFASFHELLTDIQYKIADIPSGKRISRLNDGVDSYKLQNAVKRHLTKTYPELAAELLPENVTKDWIEDLQTKYGDYFIVPEMDAKSQATFRQNSTVAR